MTDSSTPPYFPEPEPEVIDFPHGDVIDSRDIIAVLDSDDETFEPDVLADIENAAAYSPDWRYGATVIAADYFEDYARALAEDIGAISSDDIWPLDYIDWPAAARALAADYIRVTIDGRDYYIRR